MTVRAEFSTSVFYVCRSVSIELESPVVVVPRGARSTEVVVAHLGRMSLCNRPGPPRRTLYTVRVRDISLASVRTTLQISSWRYDATHI